MNDTLNTSEQAELSAWIRLEMELRDNAVFPFYEYEPGAPEFIEKSIGSDRRSFAFRFAKRTIDILISGAVILFGFIPGLILALLIRLDTGGSAIYTQLRVGRYGEPFKIHKFRTMVADAENVEKYFTPDQLKAWQREKKVDDDPRITRLGRILRATSLDEFANFLDVFTGKMSLVGPRAMSYGELFWFGEQQAELLAVRPGITGLWQAGPRNSVDFKSGGRQALELKYVRESSAALDTRVFFQTFSALVSKTGK